MYRLLLIITSILLFVFLAGCDPKKISEEVLEKEMDIDVNEIVKEIKYSDSMYLVFYTFDTEVTQHEKVEKFVDVLNIAFYQGNSKNGYKFLGERSWVHNNHPKHFESYYSNMLFSDDKEDIHVNFGRIHNPEIVEVEVGNDDSGYFDAEIFEKNGTRFFYKIYTNNEKKFQENDGGLWSRGFIARGITKDGEILLEQ
ncbi:hypothetical protein [Ornithinibacillus californiensis]|uniref:hypothetical protein n=1 Tax=Ornithinibacillus californiensis TaxID=161536 RepID=UPI00064DF400|nr:hypothetical protein [Ornithinibacillus californiensis]